MSRLKKLIQKLCPDGVEYKEIGQIADCTAGATPKTEVIAFWENGTIPWMSSGEVNRRIIFDTDVKITEMGYSSCSTKMIPPNSVVIALAGQGKTRGLVAITRIPLCTNQSLCAIVTDSSMNSDFLYHFLRSQYKQLRSISSGDGTRGGLNLSIIKSFLVPLPPLPVQEEIVRILDKFTALEVELEAELEARKKQYEYFLDWLLEAGTNVEWRTLGSSTTFIRNGYPYAADGDRNKKYKVARIETISRGKIDMTKVGSVNEVDLRFQMHEGDILFSHINSLPQLGNTAYYEEKYGNLYHGMNLLCLRAKPDCIMPKYLYYLLNSYFIRSCILRNAKHACNQYSLSISDINGWAIPVPAHAIQARIVSILDRFDALVNDITQGLPAELAARRRQYEYYRDKLLTFKEKVS